MSSVNSSGININRDNAIDCNDISEHVMNYVLDKGYNTLSAACAMNVAYARCEGSSIGYGECF